MSAKTNGSEGQKILVFQEDGSGGFSAQLGGTYAELSEAITAIGESAEEGETYSIVKVLRTGVGIAVETKRTLSKGTAHFAPRAPRKRKDAGETTSA